ncbi:MAG: polysaccharide deacetylase family protein [Pseudomonadota bacterium]|nr:polysaccharide deacetylase family protein [Pseudomonadota bacterium]
MPLTTAPDDRRWRPAPLIKASVLLHAGALAATALGPEIWPWTAGAVVTDQAMLTLAGLWPRCGLLGPNLKRLPPAAATRNEIAITIDDGPAPAVTPTVLDLLDRYGAKATFFCIGERATHHPDLCREIVARGHAVENHSLRHRRDFALLGLRGFSREIEAAQETLAAITGIRPRFFRAPAGLRNPLLDPVLSRLDLRLVSWTRRGFDTRNGDPGSVSARLLQGLNGGDILLLHDGNAARTTGGDAVILIVLPRLLDAIGTAGLRAVTLRSAILPSADLGSEIA